MDLNRRRDAEVRGPEILREESFRARYFFFFLAVFLAFFAFFAFFAMLPSMIPNDELTARLGISCARVQRTPQLLKCTLRRVTPSRAASDQGQKEFS